jgi:hypothetical protein
VFLNLPESVKIGMGLALIFRKDQINSPFSAQSLLAPIQTILFQYSSFFPSEMLKEKWPGFIKRKFLLYIHLITEGKFLVIKIEFGGSFGMTLEEDCHEDEVTPNLELLGQVWYELRGSLS